MKIFSNVIIALAVVEWAFIAAAYFGLFLPEECRGTPPAVVQFHQGMTLCPHQSAVVTLFDR